MASDGRLAGKIAVITGAGEGIGRAAALLFATEGAALGLIDADANRLAATIKMIERKRPDSRVVWRVVDVAAEPGVEAAMADFATELGGIDVLYNNAGIWDDRDGSVTELDLAAWDRTIAVNLTGVMLCCRAAIPHMVTRGGGSIINTSSPVALKPEPVFDAYTASKGGVLSLTYSLAQFYADRGIRVNVVLPGAITTAMTRDAFADPGYRRRVVGRIPLGRLGEPEEVARMALFLASDESSYVTGSIQSVDGGWIHGTE